MCCPANWSWSPKTALPAAQYATGVPQSSCIFEHVYFARPDSKIFGRWVQESRDADGPPARARVRRAADIVVPVPDSGVTAALGYAARERHSVPLRPHPQPLRGPHLHRAGAARARLRRASSSSTRCAICSKASASCSSTTPSSAAPPAARSCAWCAAPARRKCICASVVRPPSRPASTAWTRRAKDELIAANNTVEEIRQFIEADSLPISRSKGSEGCDGGEGNGFCVACYTGNYPTEWVDVEEILPATAVQV